MCRLRVREEVVGKGVDKGSADFGTGEEGESQEIKVAAEGM